MLAPAWISHLELSWELDELGRWLRALGRFPRVMIMDQRGIGLSDRVVMVLSLDVLSFRSARRALSLLEELGLEERCDFVVNRARRSEIVPNDVRRAFGRPPLAVIPSDRSVGNAQDRGRLLPARGRAARGIDKLAATLMEGAS